MTGPLFFVRGIWVLTRTPTMNWRAHIVAHDPCPYCCLAPRADHGKERMTVEHVIPKIHGGTNLLENLVSAHQGCNQQRSAHPLLAFLLFRLEMSKLRGNKGTPSRKERERLRRQFWRTK